jgi:hypothetical protein
MNNTFANKYSVKSLVEKAGGTYTRQNVITTKQNGLPIEFVEKFAKMIVLECHNWCRENGGSESVDDLTDLMEHFGLNLDEVD